MEMMYNIIQINQINALIIINFNEFLDVKLFSILYVECSLGSKSVFSS